MTSDDENGLPNAGWKVIQSIGMELDAALAIAGGSFMAAGLTSEIAPLQKNSPEWQDGWKEFYGSMNWYSSVFESACILTGHLGEADYSIVTLAIRQTSPEQALENIWKIADPLNLSLEKGLTVEDSIVQLFVKYRRLAYESIGLVHPKDMLYETRLVKEIRFCLEILQGGKNHDRFWHWVDQFYYGVYHPWREERLPFMERLDQKVVTVLGDRQSHGRVADLNWLSGLNPALRYPEIGTAIRSGDLFVNYWLEPFGFSDTFTLLPGQIYISFAEPGQMYENFMAYSRQLSGQVQAMADPTRLIILRLIRVLSMTNTDMAAYLGLSRPTVSIHAKILREAGLINSREEGRITRHEINPEAVRKLFNDLEVFLDLPPEAKPE
jgi:DNA-binding transcriptional ArsR family regulator